MPDPTTPPPLDDREKVARALWDALPDEDERGAFEDHPAREWIYRDADAVLAVLDLPARDRDTARAALTGYATEMEAWNLDTSRTEARRVRHYRDTEYETGDQT